ncbi:hypothetical protein J3R82DRAFT_8729 [Butyriboletus roseoflavus]|nr:hypothetical protein J3R82DRAFT_8729 [Butyriboletus roseoflavus]
MAALNLHNAIFTNEKDSDLPLCSAASFLHPAPERDQSPTGQLFSSTAYQDLIQRQPTHPDGPTSGWDLGLNLLGDPITIAERKSLGDHQTKMKLRRLHVINVAFELLFGMPFNFRRGHSSYATSLGIWGMYTTVRYFLAFAGGLGDAEHVFALVLGIMSALAVALVIISVSMPLIPQQSHSWRYTRLLLRACYLLLLSAGATMNLALVLMWHPTQLCNWDIDISWYISAVNTITSPCHPASFVAWITAAVLRLVVTLTVALSFIYTLRSYYWTRHPTFKGNSPKYSPYFPSDAEDISPVPTSAPLRFPKATKRTLSEDSNHTFNQSNITLPKSNSISTLAPSTSCTGYSRPHSSPPLQDVSLPRISPPTSRRTSSHGSSSTQIGSETPFPAQPVNTITASSWTPLMLRRMSRISVTQVMSDTMLSDVTPHAEMLDSPTNTRDPFEIRPCATWKPGHRGTGVHLDVRRTSLGWGNGHEHHASQTSVEFTHDEGESIKDDDVLAYSYGYGTSGPTYPYLDMYNPQRPESSSCEDEDERGLSRGHRGAIPSGAGLPDAFSEPRSSPSREEEEESSGEEEEYVAMMGGFVRRMATIESLGSKEAAGTLSRTGSVARHSMRSGAPTSQFSSVRFADLGSSCTSSLGMSLSREGSLSTAYHSLSSGGMGMRVNERGELLVGSCNASRSAAGSPYDRRYYTASGSVDDEDR